MRIAKSVHHGGDARPGYAWPAVVTALLCTLAVFALLPLSEWIDRARPVTLDVRTIDTTPLNLETPELREHVLPEPAPEREETRTRSARPALDVPAPARPTRTKLPVSFDLGPVEFAGDFSLDFTVLPGEIALAGLPDAGPDIYELSEVDQPPQPLVRRDPVYPYLARRREIEGFVSVRFSVTAEGRVEDVRILESEPGDTFDKSVTRAVSTWRFEPAMKDGKPVPVSVEITLHFEKQEGRKPRGRDGRGSSAR